MAAFTIKPAQGTRDDILRVIKNMLINRGVPNPNVTAGSDWYVLAQAVANEIEVAQANTQIKADEQMPDTATGPALARLATVYGLQQRAAAPSYGYITFDTSATCAVTVLSQLTDTLGQRYQVQVGGTYANDAIIPVIALDTGAGTNHLAGDVLRWKSPPTYAAPTAIVSMGGLHGGIDKEDDETLRARLLDRLRYPPGSGNWPQVATFVEMSSALVQKAFVYPAANGPATLRVAVVGYATATAKTRDVDATTVTTVLSPTLLGALPEYAETVLTTVANVNADVAISMSLPASSTSSPAGPGGGWVNGTPWPQPPANLPCAVTAVSTPGLTFTLSTHALCPDPALTVTEVCWLSPIDWTLYTAKVASFTGTAPSFTVTLDRPFPGIAIGHFVWPNAAQAQSYVDSLLAAFALMGPGEVVANTGVLARAYRHPIPTASWPYSLGPVQLRALTDAGPEVLDVQYLYRSTTTPAVPGAVTTAPNILIPRNLGFYAA